jgi:nicotinamidase/pyrazinamidase
VDPIDIGQGDALLVVDVQNDFLPGGALAVPHGDEVVPVLNVHLARFAREGLPVFLSRDWHPEDHCSFAIRGGPWPAHCVAGTWGAGFAAALRIPDTTVIVSKATNANADAYSAFDDTGLDRQLRDRGIRRLCVGGLATDYCIKATVLDALERGFAVSVLEDAVRAVDVHTGDGAAALSRLRSQGARIIAHSIATT